MKKTVKIKKTVKNIFRRGKVYWVRYTLDGKEVRESSRCRNLKDAKDFLNTRKEAIKDPNLRSSLPVLFKDVKFEVLSGKFSEHCEDQKCWKRSKQFLVAALNGHYAGMPVSKITKTELERFVKKLKAEGLKESTINRHLTALSHMLSFGKDEGMVSAATQKVLRDFKPFDEKKFWRKHYLTPEQCVALGAACKEVSEHLFCAFLIAIYTGLRQCDVLNLRWSNFDLESKEAKLIMIKTGLDLELPIPDSLYRYLVDRSDGKSETDDFLVTWHGKPIKSVRKSFAQACQAAGIEGLRFHDLRHTFASFIAKTEPLQVVAKFLGHTSLRCTIRYSHICDEQMVNAAAKVDKLINI